MTFDEDTAVLKTPIDLTGPDMEDATAAAAKLRRRRGFTLAVGAGDPSPPPSPVSGTQDARVANFTPARRTPTPASRRGEPSAAGDVAVVGGSSWGGGSSGAQASGPGRRGEAIDLSSDNEQEEGEGSSPTQPVGASATGGGDGASSTSSQKNVGGVTIKLQSRGGAGWGLIFVCFSLAYGQLLLTLDPAKPYIAVSFFSTLPTARSRSSLYVTPL